MTHRLSGFLGMRAIENGIKRNNDDAENPKCSEARRVVEFLDNHSLPCPFCGIQVCACDNSCCASIGSLKRTRIPIFIDYFLPSPAATAE